MAKTFLQLQEEALHDRFDEQKYGELVKEWINEGVRRIYRAARIAQGEVSATFETEIGQSTYALSADEIQLRSLRDTVRGVMLQEKDIDWVDQASATPGVASCFALYGTAFVLWPTPAEVYTIERRAVARSPLVTSDGAFLGLDEDYERLPVLYARAFLYEGEEDPEMATYYRNLFATELRELRGVSARRSIGRRDQQPSMWDALVVPRFNEP